MEEKKKGRPGKILTREDIERAIKPKIAGNAKARPATVAIPSF